MEMLRIPFKAGRIVVLGDLHSNSYDRLSRDPKSMLGREDALCTADALILAGDLINGPDHSWAKVGETDVTNVSISYPDELRGQSTPYQKKACIWESDHDR